MYKIPGDTLFVGKNLIVLPACGSTNSAAAEWTNTHGVVEGTVIITDRQESGRGQRGNSWEAEPGANLTLSVVLQPKLPAANAFEINMAVSLAVRDTLEQFRAGTVAVKWPNDIMLNGKKVCGILIENAIAGGRIGRSIVGIGININQRSFQAPHASSLAIETNKSYDLNEILGVLLHHLEARYLQMRSNIDAVRSDYRSAMYRRGVLHRFRSNADIFQGVIQGVDSVGRLQVNDGVATRAFGLKEIVYLD